MTQVIPIIDLEVVHHNDVYLSFEIATFDDGEIEGDMRIEGPYLTIFVDGKKASIKLEELTEKLLKHIKERP